MQAVVDVQFETLRQKVLKLTGIDLEHYKGSQLKRRLETFAQRHRAGDLVSLAQRLERDPHLLREFRDFLTINVSEFYRNPEKFNELKETILPSLLRQTPRLRVWSAGCSHGAEVYTVAMLLEELTPGRAHYLLATDIDAVSLERARRAVYGENEMRSLPERLRRRFFRQVEEGYQLKEPILSRVEFRHHNLLQDPFPEGMNLILCRNVVIYFTEEAKARLYRRFAESLQPGGVLFIGATETIFQPHKFGLELMSSCFYRKTQP